MIFLRGNGIVISKKEVEEADRYITVFMEDFGKISTLVKGIRKSKKRDKTAVDVLSLTSFNFYKKGDKIILSDFSALKNYENIKFDLEKLNIALYFFSILNQVLVENGRNRKLYNLLEKSLEYLNKTDDKRKNLLLTAYFLYEIIKDEGIISETQDVSVLIAETVISQKEIDILKVLLSGNIKKLIENEDYQIINIKKVISILEKYINSNLETILDSKRFLWGDLQW